MANKNYIVQGTITNQQCEPLPGLVVLAFHQDSTSEYPLGKPAETNVKGHYKIKFSHKDFRDKGKKTSSPYIIIRVYEGGELVAHQQTGPKKQKEEIIDFKISMTHKRQKNVIKGLVKDKDGNLVTDTLVSAYRIMLRTEVFLGSCITNEDGFYAIYYYFHPAAKDKFHLALFVQGKEEELLLKTKTIYNVPTELEYNIQLAMACPGLSQFERQVKILEPLLDGQLTLADLKMDETHDDIQFLSEKTGINYEHIRLIHLDALFHQDTSIPPAVFYGLFRQGQPTHLIKLSQVKPSILRVSLEASLDQNLIPASLRENLDKILVLLLGHLVGLQFSKDEEGKIPNLGKILQISALEKNKQRLAAEFTLRFEGDPDEYYEKLKEETALEDNEIQALRFTFAANDHVFGYEPMLKAVFQLKQQRGWTTVVDLVKLRPEEWHEMAGQFDPPDQFESSEAFAEAITNQVEKTFFTPYLAARLEDLDHPDDRETITFFKNNPGFDLDTARVDDYFAKGANLTGIQDQQSLVQKIKQKKRTARLTFNTTQRVETMRVLEEQGFTSALNIAMAGENNFYTAVVPTMGKAKSKEVVKRAKTIYLVSHMLREQFRDFLNPSPRMLPQVEGTIYDPEDGETGIALLERLFGTRYGCECKHCQSMYSPAAYMVDLLQFLREIPGASDALIELFRRRPDIQHILLNCANANTSLPYIDLVNEILEVGAAGLRDFDWSKYQTPKSNGTSKKQVEQMLRARSENELASAYDLPAIQEYPWNLPFHPDWEKVRLFSQYLGIELYKIRELFLSGEDLITRDYLHLSPSEWNLLTRPEHDSNQTGVWGVPVNRLESVEVFMQQARLSYEQLETFVNTWFLSSGGLAEISINKGEDTCNVEVFTLVGLSEDSGNINEHITEQMHRFLRFCNLLGWSIEELDAVMSAYGHTSIHRDVMIDIARTRRIADTYHLPVTTVIRLDNRVLSDLLYLPEADINLFRQISGLDVEPDPWIAGASVRQGLETLEAWQFFSGSGFDLYELAYILTGWDTIPSALTPTEEEHRGFLRSLHGLVQTQGAAGEGGLSEEDIQLILVDNLAGYLGLSPGLMSRLIGPVRDPETGGIVSPAVIGAQSDLSQPAIIDFLNFVRIDGTAGFPDETEPAVFDHTRLLLIRLDRAARLLNLLSLDRRELDSIIAVLADNGFLDLNQLRVPQHTADFLPGDIFKQWQALISARQLQSQIPGEDQDLFDFLVYQPDPPDPPGDRIAYLNRATGWSNDPKTGKETNILGELFSFLSLTEADFHKVDSYARLYQGIQWLKKWRISTDTLAHWGDPSYPETSLANSLQDTARSRHPQDEDWYKILTPIMDQLREKKRDVLLSYLIRNDTGFHRSSDVYGFYLIDPEMSSCMLTSRIKQAISSIQLFIQRILLNQEPGIGSTEDIADRWHRHWKQWEWMKNYRVWEANRKVFLYPENWIEPELRDDKSPIFIELENELLQDEVRQETIETAFRNYLHKFATLGRLQIRAIYCEEERNIIHVVVRTHSEPHVYYYCKRQPGGSWSAWEKITANIEGEHIIPVVRKGRIILFWPVFKEVTHDKIKAWDIRLSWSERSNSGWKGQKSAKNGPHILEKGRLGKLTDPAHYSFRLNEDDENLNIYLYEQIIDDSYKGRLRHVCVTKYYFAYDECTGSMEVKELETPRVYFLPNRTIANGMLLREDDSPGDWMEILYGAVNNDSINDPDEFLFPQELVELIKSGLGGIIMALILASASVENLPRFQARLQELSLGVRQAALLRDTAFRNAQYFELVIPHQSRQFLSQYPFFYQDNNKAYFITPYNRTKNFFGYEYNIPGYKFEIFFHPFVCDLLERAVNDDLDAVLYSSRNDPLDRQMQSDRQMDFKSKYHPNPSIRWVTDYPTENFDFLLSAAYSVYNWELFFHIPLLAATRLSQSQRFEEAQKWFHYIFDPTDISSHPDPAKYWRVKPFFELAQQPIQSLGDLLRLIALGDEDSIKQVTAWRNDPFNPHKIARLRNLAYMKNVVMKYLDNLIAWGDHLFQRDSIESINEATQLYILAAEILGPKPNLAPSREVTEYSYAALSQGNALDQLSNAWLELETILPANLDETEIMESGDVPGLLPYFCVPANEKLSGYWDTVADRLFKIRHCMNIEGQVRRLPLYEPPIDPALLVRARQKGLDLRRVLSELDVTMPHYRYTFMYQKALEFCNEVRSLGNVLLSALEKKDAEALALIRSRNEIALMTQVTRVRENQIKEAEHTLESLKKSLENVTIRRDFYKERLTDENKRRIPQEKEHLEKLREAQGHQNTASDYELVAAIMHALPNISAGTSFSVSFGGSNLGSVFNAVANRFRFDSGKASYQANKASTEGGYIRRNDEWKLQFDSASKEIQQIARQIAAAEIRLAIAEKELENHRLQLDQAREVNDFMQNKFTNKELYGWMAGQTSTMLYQGFQMAHQLALKAQQAARQELGLPASQFDLIDISGYWESDKKGLLAGDRLLQALRQMDMAYLEKNKRKLEITKHISLRRLNPFALLELRALGSCNIDVPEWLFDMDCPGHYLRRIQSVSLSIPAIAGPNTSIYCMLKLTESTIRVNPDISESSVYRPADISSDHRFVKNYAANQRIVTSSAQNDSGIFELNLRDERFLPFEGAGAESSWELKLPSDFRQFDYSTISDVILHIRYTSLFKETLKGPAVDYLQSFLKSRRDGLAHLFSLKHDFPNAWHQFLNSTDNLLVTIKKEHFPYLVQGRDITFTKIELVSLSDLSNKTPLAADVLRTANSDINGAAKEAELSFTEDLVLVRHKETKVFMVIFYRVT